MLEWLVSLFIVLTHSLILTYPLTHQELETRDSFKLKSVPKSSAQEATIRSALAENFVFTALEESDLKQLVNAFTLRTVKEKEDVITQGEDGDYFYVIDKGNHLLVCLLTSLLTYFSFERIICCYCGW